MAKFTPALTAQPESIQKLIRRIAGELRPESIILFGSRARGTHRETSDFDLACKFRDKNERAWVKFLVDLKENAWTLWPVDVVDYSELTSDYQRSIDREGVILYG